MFFYSCRIFILNNFEILLYDVEFFSASHLKIFLKRALYFIYNKTLCFEKMFVVYEYELSQILEFLIKESLGR